MRSGVGGAIHGGHSGEEGACRVIRFISPYKRCYSEHIQHKHRIICQHSISLSDFGAVGDNSTINTPAFEKAMQTAKVAAGHGKNRLIFSMVVQIQAFSPYSRQFYLSVRRIHQSSESHPRVYVSLWTFQRKTQLRSPSNGITSAGGEKLT